MEAWYTVKHNRGDIRIAVAGLSLESDGVKCIECMNGVVSLTEVRLSRSAAFAVAAILSHHGCVPRVIRRKFSDESTVASHNEQAKLYEFASRVSR